MFIYDKDMERVMMAKKKEVLQEIETAKLRVLKELYCIKRGIHTDMCEMLADYNRIDFNLKKAIKDAETKLETTVKEFQKIIADALEEHNRTIDTKLNELSALQSSIISEVNAALSDLDAMKTTVENLIAQCQELIDNGVTQADLDALRTEIEAALVTAGVQSDWNESDETSKAFVRNRTHYSGNVVTNTINVIEATTGMIWVNGRLDNVGLTGSYNMKVFPIENVDLSSCNSIRIRKIMGLDESGNPSIFTDWENKQVVKGKFISIFPSVKIVDGFYFGTLRNGVACLEQDANDVLIYYDNESKMLFFVIGYNNTMVNLGSSYQIETTSSTVEKTLNPEYLSVNGGIGSVLVNNGDSCSWEYIGGVNVSNIELTEVGRGSWSVDNGVVTQLNVDFDYKAISANADGYGILKIGEYSAIAKITPSSKKFVIGAKINSVICNVTVGSTFVDVSSGIKELCPNGFEITFTTYAHKVYNTPYEGEKVIFTSPNGTKYKITVSDDGVLSATAVTE